MLKPLESYFLFLGHLLGVNASEYISLIFVELCSNSISTCLQNFKLRVGTGPLCLRLGDSPGFWPPTSPSAQLCLCCFKNPESCLTISVSPLPLRTIPDAKEHCVWATASLQQGGHRSAWPCSCSRAECCRRKVGSQAWASERLGQERGGEEESGEEGGGEEGGGAGVGGKDLPQ